MAHCDSSITTAITRLFQGFNHSPLQPRAAQIYDSPFEQLTPPHPVAAASWQPAGATPTGALPQIGGDLPDIDSPAVALRSTRLTCPLRMPAFMLRYTRLTQTKLEKKEINAANLLLCAARKSYLQLLQKPVYTLRACMDICCDTSTELNEKARQFNEEILGGKTTLSAQNTAAAEVSSFTHTHPHAYARAHTHTGAGRFDRIDQLS